MAHNPLIRKVPKMTGKTTGGHKSAGILDDHAVRKVVQSQEGYFKKNQGTDVGKPIVDIENWGGDWSGQEYGMLNLKSHDNTARLIKGFDDTTNTFTLTTQGNMSIAGSLELWDGVGSIRTNRNDLNLIPNHTSDVLTGHVVIENGGDAESLEVKGGSILAESIGVGTATANDPLHVVADASDDCIRVEEASGGEYWQLKVPNTGDLVFADSDVDRITFGDGTGNITTTGDITGGNVTSGADPGHTHTNSSVSGFLVDDNDDTTTGVITAAGFIAGASGIETTGGGDIVSSGDLTTQGEMLGARVSYQAGYGGTRTGSGYLKTTNGSDFSSTHGYVMPHDGSIISITASTVVTPWTGAGNNVYQIRVNDASVFTTTITPGKTGHIDSYATQARGTDTFSAGDLIQVYSNRVSGVYTLIDTIVTFEVQFDD